MSAHFGVLEIIISIVVIGLIISLLIFMIIIGESKFNTLFSSLRGRCSNCINSACPDSMKCAHQYKYYNRQGNEDNKDSHVAKCVKCGKKIIIEE